MFHRIFIRPVTFIRVYCISGVTLGSGSAVLEYRDTFRLMSLVCCLVLSIGIEQTNAGIGIPASRILVWYRTQKMPDFIGLVRYQTCSGIVSFFHSGTGLTGCRTVLHSFIHVYTYTYIYRYICIYVYLFVYVYASIYCTYTYTYTYTLLIYVYLYIWIYKQICSMNMQHGH
jgi:hypothetical protein